MREWFARLTDWFRRDTLERELAEELRFHREHLERDARSSGMPDDEAELAARRRLGNTTAVAESARDRWSIPTLDHLQQDLRYALRGLRRSPGFTVTVIATLALGIGANTAMFAVVDRLMFRPYPYLTDPDGVHRIYVKFIRRGEERVEWAGLEYTRYLDFRKYTSSFSDFAAFAHPMLAVGSGASLRERRVAAVSGTFWNFFHARPALGRFFTPAEDTTPRGAEVAVLGYHFWQSEFGGRDVIGERLRLGHIGTTIVGVAPKGFTGVFDFEAPAVFIPITLYAGSNPAMGDRNNYFRTYDYGWAAMMARRRPGVSVDEASADLSQAHWKSYQLEREQDPELSAPEVAKPAAIAGAMKPAAGPRPSLEAQISVWLSGVTAIVLLIACANVANLLLARGLVRQRETAVRLALGVSRSRLLTQTLTESLLLALLGSAAGLVVAQWGEAAIRGMLVSVDDASFTVFTDWRTLGAAATVAVVVALLTGTAPALVSVRDGLVRSLKAGAREGTHQRSRARIGLLLAQSALSVVLLVGAGLFVASLGEVKNLRMGYDPDGALIVYRNQRGMRPDSARLVALRRELVATAQATPGVAHAAWISSVPFWATSSTDLFVPGIDSVGRLGAFSYQLATADFFAAMGTRILRGRGFTDADREGAPRVAVVSDGMAAVLWPGRDAIGQCMRVGSDSAPCTTVVGIAEDIVQRENQLEGGPRLHYYMPIEQYRPHVGNWLVVRMHGNATAQQENVRKALQAVMPGESYVTVRRLSEAVDGVQRGWQLGARLFVAFGMLALAIAAIGLYGVVAYNVTQRTHELGVRVALGAQRWDILRLVVGQSARLALAGVAIGCVLALLAARWVEPLLFRQSARDPLIYGAVAGIMVLVALCAAASPAARAAKADPNRALRAE